VKSGESKKNPLKKQTNFVGNISFLLLTVFEMELNICGLDDDAPLPAPRPKKKTWAERQQQAPPARKERLRLLQVKEREEEDIVPAVATAFFFSNG